MGMVKQFCDGSYLNIQVQTVRKQKYYIHFKLAA